MGNLERGRGRGEGEDRERGGGIIPPSNSFKARGANGELGKGVG